MNNYGVVLKRLRKDRGLTIKQASETINRGVGWLCEVENSNGTARIDTQEFERIVKAYGAAYEPQKFSGWTTLEAKMSKKRSLQFDGAILKYLRQKAKLNLNEASKILGVANGYLSDLENGRKSVNLTMRNKIMGVYNYSPSSFKNFNSEDKRAKNIPVKFKLNIILNHLDENALGEILEAAIQKIEIKKGA